MIVKQEEYLDYWKGNFSGADSLIIEIGSYSFDYTANESGVYEMYFVNPWENQDPVSISLRYSAPQRDMKAQSLSIPYLSQMHFREIMEAGESISGNFNVTGHPNQGILFTLLLPKCSQSVSFTFVLANTGQVDASTSARLEADGRTVWSDGYSVEAEKISAGRGTATINDCNEHTYILKLG